MAVIILDYQDRWPGEFRELATRLRGALGDLALRIDHIGSTSVPRLAAKDVIDIQITVAALEEPVQTAITSLGYQRSEINWRDHCPPMASPDEREWEKWGFIQPEGRRRINIHTRIVGRANQRYALLFRDFLRAQRATADAYAELKRRLAASLRDPAEYPDVKDPAVDLIYFAAEAWAESTHWGPGPSDA